MSHNNAYDYMIVVTDGAADYWRLDQTVDSLVDLAHTDTNTSTTPGTGTTTDLLPAANNHYSTYFNPSNSDYISFNDNHFYNYDTNGLNSLSHFSIECWIKPDADQSATDVIGIAGQPGVAGLALMYGVPTFYVYADAGGGTSVRNVAQASSAVSVGSIYHLVGTFSYDGSTNGILKLYVNGSQDGSGINGLHPSYSNAANFTIGSWDTSVLFFHGWISNVAIYGSTLNSTKVSNHYNYSG